MFIYAGADYDPNDVGANPQPIFYSEDEDVQRNNSCDYKQLWQMQGFTEPLTNFYCYGFSNAAITLARSLGYGQIGALCADQNWTDGGTEFNALGLSREAVFYCHR